MFEYKYDFSIVMTYFNRKPQTINTLDYFEKSYSSYNYEVVIVDDSSNIDNCLDDVIPNYSFPINYIKISAEDKGDRVNPCVPYNIGFRSSLGRIVVIQNPECIHRGNLLQVLLDNLTNQNYLCFSCYNCATDKLTKRLLQDISLINDKEFHNENRFHWYNHPQFNPVHLHFCSAIMNDNLKVLGGFNEEFAKGHSFDDNELLLSIRNKLCLEIRTIPPEQGLVIHQWHSHENESNISGKKIEYLYAERGYSMNLQKRIDINRQLYHKYIGYYKQYNFNFPRLLHLYWDGSNFSYLNLLTIISFNKHHFGWKINVYCPTKQNKEKTWHTNEQKDNYDGVNFFHKLYSLDNVTIHKIDFDLLPFKYKDASEVIKSDYFRLFILNKYGGVWSDFDIIYTSSIEKYIEDKDLENSVETVLFQYPISVLSNIYPVGLFISHKNSCLFQHVLSKIDEFYNKTQYQCLGSEMFKKLFEDNIYKDTSKNYIGTTKFLNADCYLPIKWNELDQLYSINSMKNTYENNQNIIGVHWFNGSYISKNYCNNLDLARIFQNNINSYMDKLIYQFGSLTDM